VSSVSKNKFSTEGKNMHNLSKTLWLSLVLFAIFLFSRPAEAKYGGGTGEPNDPYLIYTAEQINAIGANRADWDKHFKLMSDIDLIAYTGTAFNLIGYWVSWDDYKQFTGVFDGGGHTISNFTYTSTRKRYIGLFVQVRGENAEIKNLGLIDPDIDAGTGDCVGSLVGANWGRITNCYAEGGSVRGDRDVGGLVGKNWGGGIVTNCYSSSEVSGNDSVGGLVGSIAAGTVSNCCSTGSVSGNESVGGLVGLSWLTINRCYATGSVSGTKEEVGGLVGTNYGIITNCYAAGSVSGTKLVGGLVGHGYGPVTTSLWDTKTSGQRTSAGGRGKTTAEMKMAITFTGWGVCGNEGIWTIDEGNDYPRLWWEKKPGKALDTQKLSDFLTGTGTQDDPYLIYKAEQYNMIGLFPCEWSKHFKLMADIDLKRFTGTDFNIIGTGGGNYSFSGIFNGNGHKISNFNYTSTGVSAVGLFGYVGGRNAEIKDLGLLDPNVDAGTGHCVGSLVGYLVGGAITHCYAEDGSVSGNECVGGLVGTNPGGRITKCYSRVVVRGTKSVGGLAGYNRGSVSTSYSGGAVSGTSGVGGLVGTNHDSITTSYSTGPVDGVSEVGGLVGANVLERYVMDAVINGTIASSYSTGAVTGSKDVGGLVGVNSGSIASSFWDIQTSGRTWSAGGTGKTTAEMQMASTFLQAGWDFVGETANDTQDIWWILEGKDYPRLWWEAHN